MLQYRDTQLTIFESALFRTTSTLFQSPDMLLLVDPTWLPQEIVAIKNEVDLIRGKRPLYLLFTHSDYDHIIAWKAFPDAITIASQAFIDNPEKEKQLNQIRKFDDENYITRPYPIAYPVIDIAINQNGQQLKIGNTTLTFYLSPGHNLDGIFTIIEPHGIWIAGDYLSNIEFPYIYHSSIAYEDLLQKVDTFLEKHTFRILVPGHGDHCTEPTEIRRRAKNDLAYIQRLREAIARGETPEPASLYKPILFPQIMHQFHEGNIRLLKEEQQIR
ncbi:MAG: MBL fold metallo-hydrolase [Saprospiraceae bacterium]|nr:MBL fold metallo-hydrolase [Saprospiraceae bacterium]